MAGDKGVIVKETHLAAETWSAVVDWSPVTYDALWDVGNQCPRDLWALIYNDPTAGTLMYPPLQLFSVDGDETGLTLMGVGPLHALGSGGIGPTVLDDEYLSGADKLGNPTFALSPNDLYWVVGDSIWVIGNGYATTSSATEVYEDQALICDEKFPAVEGAGYSSTVTIGRIASYSVGRLRLRHVYTGGPFVHADELPAFSTWAASTGTTFGDHDILYDAATDAFVVGPSARRNLLPNPSFEDPGGVGSLNGWTMFAGNWFVGTTGGGFGDAHYAFTNTSAASGFKYLQSNTAFNSILPGEQYSLRMAARPSPSFTNTDGEAYLVAALATGAPPYTFVATDHAVVDGQTTGQSGYRYLVKDFDISAGQISMSVFAVVAGQTLGQWDIDGLELVRKKGNLDFATSPIFAITPGRAYRWTQPVTTDVGVTGGTVSLAMVCFVATRPEVIIQGPSIQVTGGAAQVIEWDFTPPSGMDVCKARIVCQDVVGGAVRFPNAGASIRQADTSTAVLEAIGPLTAPTNVPLTLTSTAPVGAKDVHLELVAEAYGIGWVVSNFNLIRTTASPATGASIVAAILTNPTTGAPLGLTAGTITAPNPIPYDWRVIRTTRRDELDHLCAVVSEPVLEYKVNATNPPTLSVGPASVVFATHPLAEAILPTDREVESLSNPVTDTSDRPTEIVVVGNDRQTVSGRPIPITATAAVPGPVRRDLGNRPVTRTETVVRTTVDHRQYAQALADDLALQAAEPALALSLKLSGTTARADAPPGDTVYAYHPESGLQDTANTVTIAGRTVYPRAVRVLARERSLGPAHRIVMRAADGTTFPLLGVRWSDEDAVALTVGDRLPDWVSDPQGGAEGKQYAQDRAKRPR